MTAHKTPRTIPFTASRLTRLQPPESGRIVFHDAKCPGLTLRITASGSKTFGIQRRVHGRPVRVSLGRFPETSIASARAQAGKAHDEINKGVSPLESRKAKRAEARLREQSNLTLSEAWEKYKTGHLMRNCSPRTVQNDGYFFNAIGDLAERRLGDITTADAIALHKKITASTASRKKRKPAEGAEKRKRKYTPKPKPENPGSRGTMANRVILFMQRLYGYSIAELGFSGPNPIIVQYGGKRVRWAGSAKGEKIIRLAPESSRDRVLSVPEVAKFLSVLDEEPDNIFFDLFRLMLYCGVRRSACASMKWSDVSLDSGEWRIGEDVVGMKGQSATIYLSAAAMEIPHRRRRAVPESCRWVFPTNGNLKSEGGHIVEVRRAWDSVRERTGIRDIVPHDLRRTHASFQRLAGSDRATIARTLGHAENSKMTGVYDRISPEMIRSSVESATALMLAAGTVAESGED